MRTCPACGKENEDTDTHCVTCGEEIGATSVVTAEEPKAPTPAPEEKSIDVGENETLAVSLAELRAMSSKDENTEKAEKAVVAAEVKPTEIESAPAALSSPATVKAAEEEGVSKAIATPAEANEKPADEHAEAGAAVPAHVPATPPPSAVPAEKPAAAVAVEEPRAQATQVVQVEPSARSSSPFQPGTVKLVVEQGMSVNKEYLLNDPELIIGRRDPEQEFIPDIDLFDQENANNRYISRRQARLYFQEGHLFVEDLDSSNGTCVNNRPIKPNMSVQLNPGDKLLLGQSVMFRIRPMTS